MRRQPRQGTSGKSRFLDACRAFNNGELPLAQLHEATVQLGFANVVDAFPRLGRDSAPIAFYEDNRKAAEAAGLVLTDHLLDLAQSTQRTLLHAEADSRWRLVETAWATGVNTGLLIPVVRYDREDELLYMRGDVRGHPVTGARGALSGYQDGRRCAYCSRNMATVGLGTAIVEHVLPWTLMTRPWSGPDVDAVWNLVLSCDDCNSAKSARAPDPDWMLWLEARNNDLIASRHHLRETLIAQTGGTEAERSHFLRAAYAAATTSLPSTWTPPVVSA